MLAPYLRVFHRRIIYASSNFFRASQLQYTTNRSSGYESETAEIRDALKQFNVNESSFFEDDDLDLENKKPRLSGAMPVKSIKRKSLYDRRNVFVDYRRVQVRGGKGGDGMICFLQLWSNPMAGPSGGDGGNGGHVIFEASKHMRSLSRVKSNYTGLPGENGMQKDMTGKSAEHLVIKVPIGTLIKNSVTGKLIAEMHCEGMKFLAGKGGAGGKGNHYFLSNVNRHPRVAEVGATGEHNTWILELKMIAHAGLVGFPNAGKSTLLSAVSRAKPKVASYPFTTLNPMVGMVQYDDGEQLAIADLPGIIEDAHKNHGLGISFLKHVERCVCLFFVIDISATDPFQQLRTLMRELELYKEDLSKRPIAVVVNKIDIEFSDEKLNHFCNNLEQHNLAHLRVFPISAKYGHNLTQLLVYLRELYDMNYSSPGINQNNKMID